MKKKFIPLLSLLTLGGTLASCGNSNNAWEWKTAIADGELGYVILVGEDGNPEAIDRTKGCIAAMDEIAKQGNFVAKELERKTCINEGGSWNDTVAKETVETWTKKYKGKLDFIISNNDGMAIAAANASGLAKGTPIIGFDALSAACDMIKEGTLAGSVSQNGDDQALATVRVLTSLVKNSSTVIDSSYGGKAELNLEGLSEHIVQTKFAAVTKQNADSLKPGSYVDVAEDSAIKGKKMLVATYNNNDNFIKETYRQALPAYATKLGYTVDVIEGDGIDDAVLQQKIQTQMKVTQYDCFAFNIITHANWESYQSLVGDKPLVFFNRQPKTSDDKNVADLSSKEKTYFVGSGSVGQGVAQGQIIKDWFNALEK
ncbi:MAG TPA: hypothetical protein DCR94_05240 [Firmicutes bacterium]|nr:hypothetical protein [Bacillota bacterium]